MLEGCDFEHWLVVVEPPDPQLTRDDIIDVYIKTLARIIGSEEEARMKIYSVSTRHYFAFGALVSEELSYKLKELPNVRWVLPDSYMDVKNKTYAVHKYGINFSNPVPTKPNQKSLNKGIVALEMKSLV
uniref:MORF/ORRM1/DAG-like MORF domain-containing protein n=1 Tax=Chenopodium quinoa TaxID=63459 RepID=A0A803LXF6_CHEQI